MPIDARFRARLAHVPARVFPVVEDLATYPAWLGIVHRVTVAPSGEGDDAPAWLVDLGARLGPIRRTKRVRMVRTAAEQARLVRFERHELDDRPHPDWVLEVTLAEASGPGTGTATDLGVSLTYSGAPSLPLLDVVLAGEARRAAGRLGDLVAQRAD